MSDTEEDAPKGLTPPPFPALNPATQSWLLSAFPMPTTVQTEARSAIEAGSNIPVIAPTGSGKTLAAFLHAIDQLFSEHRQYARNGQSGTRGKDERASHWKQSTMNRRRQHLRPSRL